MLDLHHLNTFRAVVIAGSFTRAAAELGYAQSSVTTHIKALERYLGVLLFERFRFSKTIALTEAGRRVLGYAERVLTLAEEAEGSIRTLSKVTRSA